MSKLNNKEQEFKNILESVAFEVDSSEIWAGISDRLPVAEKRRRPVWLFILLGFGMFLTISTLFYLNMNKKSAVVMGTDSTYTELVKSDLVIQSEETNLAASQSASEEEIESSQTIDNNSIYQPGTLEHTPISDRTEVVTLISTNGQESRAVRTGSYEDKNHQLNIAENVNEKSIAVVENNIKNQKAVLIENPSEENVFMLDNISLLNIGVGKLQHERVFDFDQMHFVQTRIEPVQETKKYMTFFSLRSGLNQSFSRYSSVGEVLDFTALEPETDLIGTSHDLLYGLEFKNGFYVGAGLSHTALISRYKNHIVDEYEETIEGTQSILLTSNGDSQAVQGEITRTVRIDKDYNWHRRHQLIDLQFIAGKHFLLNESWAINTEIGLSQNLNAKHRGYFFNNTKEVISTFESKESSPYASNTGISWKAGFGIEYRFQDCALGLNSFYRAISKKLQDPADSSGLINDSSTTLKNSHIGLQLNFTYRPAW